MKNYGEYQGIPGHWMAGRWIATHYGWGKIRNLVRELAEGRCESRKLAELGLLDDNNECAINLQWFDVHHRFGRGGGKRDDRPRLDNGEQNLFAVCRACHSRTRIERRLAYQGSPVAEQNHEGHKQPSDTLG